MRGIKDPYSECIILSNYSVFSLSQRKSSFFFNILIAMIFKIRFLYYFTIIGLLHLLTVSAQEGNDDPKVSRSKNFVYKTLSPPACGIRNVQVPRIYGGHLSARGAWPWVAALGFEIEADFTNETLYEWDCAGSLISHRHILTAAHCVYEENLIVARLGDLNIYYNDGRHAIEIPVEERILHPEFNSTTNENDIAVLALSQDVSFNDYVHPICLPSTDTLLNRPFANEFVTIAGWGRTETGKDSIRLREVKVYTFANDECERRYQLVNLSIIDDRVICAGARNKDACEGDSGGPLMIRINSTYYQIGLLSTGHLGCNISHAFPTLYTRVTTFMDFITSAIE